MLKNILSASDCKQCRICCCFEHYELWETPIITPELKQYILSIHPEQKFVQKGSSFLLQMTREDENSLYFCPMLNNETGCTLGDKKPFDCKIWPYRIMRLGDRLAISIASICPTLYNKPLKELVDELGKNNLGEKIFEEAKKCPDIIKEYQSGYPILLVR